LLLESPAKGENYFLNILAISYQLKLMKPTM